MSQKQKETKNIHEKAMQNDELRVTGVGGIFLKTKNTDDNKKWDLNNLGLNTDKNGTSFGWFSVDNPKKKGFNYWNPFNGKTKH